MIRKGAPWGIPALGPPDVTGEGDDAALARLVERHPGALLRFVPTPECDLARAIGLTEASTGDSELSLDVLRTDGALAVNMIVLGHPPDLLRWYHRAHPVTVEVDGRVAFQGDATTVVVANGQFLRAADVVPRGHPGDAKAEVQVYATRRSERSELRRRLPTGTHVPNPRILQKTGTAITVTWQHAAHTELDGEQRPATQELHVELAPNAYRVLV